MFLFCQGDLSSYCRTLSSTLIMHNLKAAKIFDINTSQEKKQREEKLRQNYGDKNFRSSYHTENEYCEDII